MHSLQTRRNKQIKMKWTWKQWQKKRERGREPGARLSMRGQAEKKGGRKGVFSFVIGAVEVISDLKSSRCGSAPEKEKESERLREVQKSSEREEFYQTVPTTCDQKSTHSFQLEGEEGEGSSVSVFRADVQGFTCWKTLSGCGVSGGQVVEGRVASTAQSWAYKKQGWSE